MGSITTLWRVVLSSKCLGAISTHLADSVHKSFVFLGSFVPAFVEIVKVSVSAVVGDLKAASSISDIAAEVKQLRSLQLQDDARSALQQSGFSRTTIEHVDKVVCDLLGRPRSKSLVSIVESTLKQKFKKWQDEQQELLKTNGPAVDDIKSFTELLSDCELICCSQLALQVKFWNVLSRCECAAARFDAMWTSDASVARDKDKTSIANQAVMLLYKDLNLTAKAVRAMRDNGAASHIATAGFASFKFMDADVKSVIEKCLTDVDALLDTARTEWNADFKALCETVASWCPAWQLESNSDTFPTREMVKSLIMNPKFKQLAPAANLLGDALTASSSLVRDGCPPLFPADLLKQGMSVSV